MRSWNKVSGTVPGTCQPSVNVSHPYNCCLWPSPFCHGRPLRRSVWSLSLQPCTTTKKESGTKIANHSQLCSLTVLRHKGGSPCGFMVADGGCLKAEALRDDFSGPSQLNRPQSGPRPANSPGQGSSTFLGHSPPFFPSFLGKGL